MCPCYYDILCVEAALLASLSAGAAGPAEDEGAPNYFVEINLFLVKHMRLLFIIVYDFFKYYIMYYHMFHSPCGDCDYYIYYYTIFLSMGHTFQHGQSLKFTSPQE